MTSSWTPRHSVRRAAAIVGGLVAVLSMSVCIPTPSLAGLPFTALPSAPSAPDPTTTLAPTTTTTVPNAGLTAAIMPVDPARAGFNVSFGAQNSTDSTGTITGYTWDFGDPTSVSNTGTHVVEGHVYDQPGSYTVTLTISDNHGATKSTTTSVAVAAAPTLVPCMTVSPANPVAGQAVTFSATCSTDSAGTITSYVWSFPSGVGMRTGSSVTVTFANAGYQLPVLTASDDHGHSDTNNATVWVGP